MHIKFDHKKNEKLKIIYIFYKATEKWLAIDCRRRLLAPNLFSTTLKATLWSLTTTLMVHNIDPVDTAKGLLSEVT